MNPRFLLIGSVLIFFPCLLALPTGKESSGDQYVSRPLTVSNYKRIIDAHPNVFVKFFTYWCYFSQQVFETWENVGEHYAYNHTNIVIAEIDCEAHKALCRKFKIREFPQLIMFKDGHKYEKYIGPRTKNDITNYVTNYLNSQ